MIQVKELEKNDSLLECTNEDAATLQNLLHLSRSSTNSNFQMYAMRSAAVQSIAGSVPSSAVARTSRQTILSKAKNTIFKYTRRAHSQNIESAMYTRSYNSQELKLNRPKLSETDITIIDNYRSITLTHADRIDNPGIRQTILTGLAQNRALADKLHSLIQFNSLTKIDNLKHPIEDRKAIKQIQTEMGNSINSLLDELVKMRMRNNSSNIQIELPYVNELINERANLERVCKVYSHPYFLKVLENIKESAQTSPQARLNDINRLIENCNFIQKGVQIDHILPTALRTALFSHVLESTNVRNNQDMDSHLCTFIPVHKSTKKQIQTNLNSVRTAGTAATALSSYTSETTLKNDLRELRDNGLFGDTFREGVSQLNLTPSQKEVVLIHFVNSFEFVIDEATRAMEIKYGITEPTISVPQSYFMVIYDFNIRLQGIFQAVRKTNNVDTANVLDIDQIHGGLLDVVKHKNSIIYFIDQIFKTTKSSLLNTSAKNLEKINLQKEEIKNAIEQDFKNLIY